MVIICRTVHVSFLINQKACLKISSLFLYFFTIVRLKLYQIAQVLTG